MIKIWIYKISSYESVMYLDKFLVIFKNLHFNCIFENYCFMQINNDVIWIYYHKKYILKFLRMFSINIARSQKQRVILNNENKSPVLFVYPLRLNIGEA